MKSTILLLSLVAVATIGHGLNCYQCQYIIEDGTGVGNSACQNNNPGSDLSVPCTSKNTKTPDEIKALLENTPIINNGTSTKAVGDPVCFKSKGTTTGRSGTFRGCATALVNENLDGTCETGSQVVIGGVTYNMKSFYCTSNNCNTGSVDGTCSGSPTITAAPSIIILMYLSVVKFLM